MSLGDKAHSDEAKEDKVPEAGSVMSLSTSFPVGIGRAIKAAARRLIVSDTAR